MLDAVRRDTMLPGFGCETAHPVRGLPLGTERIPSDRDYLDESSMSLICALREACGSLKSRDCSS